MRTRDFYGPYSEFSALEEVLSMGFSENAIKRSENVTKTLADFKLEFAMDQDGVYCLMH